MPPRFVCRLSAAFFSLSGEFGTADDLLLACDAINFENTTILVLLMGIHAKKFEYTTILERATKNDDDRSSKLPAVTRLRCKEKPRSLKRNRRIFEKSCNPLTQTREIVVYSKKIAFYLQHAKEITESSGIAREQESCWS